MVYFTGYAVLNHVSNHEECPHINIQILTANEGNGGKLLSRGEIQPWPTIHRGQ